MLYFFRSRVSRFPGSLSWTAHGLLVSRLPSSSRLVWLFVFLLLYGSLCGSVLVLALPLPFWLPSSPVLSLCVSASVGSVLGLCLWPALPPFAPTFDHRFVCLHPCILLGPVLKYTSNLGTTLQVRHKRKN